MNLLFSFFGRTGRGGLWLTFVISFVLSIAAANYVETTYGPMSTLLTASGEPVSVETAAEMTAEEFEASGITINWNWDHIYALLIASIPALWIYLAGSVKRAHDRGKSGWWVLIAFIPVAGFIWWLIDLGVFEGQEGDNRYGPDPRAPKDGTRSA